MKVTTQELGNCEVILTVEIDDKQKSRILEKAARRISRQVRIPGFRPGKAPYRIIINKFGVEAVQEEAMEDLTNDVFRKALEEADVTPYAQASLDEINWEPLVMKVKIPTEPVIDLGDFHSIRVDFDAPEVTDDELDKELEQLRDRNATFEAVDRAAQIGDQAAITVSEKDLASGEMLAEERDLNLMLEESDEDDPAPDMSANVVGLAAGEQKIWNHTYPEDYQVERFAGKAVEVFVKVNEVREKETPDLDDDLAALVGDYDTLDDLKAGLRDDLLNRKQNEIDRDLIPQVMDQLLESVENISWPAALEEQEIDHSLEHRKQDLTRQGLDLQTYLQMQQQTEEELREEIRETVQENLKTSLVLGKVIEVEKLEVDPEALARQAELMVMISGGTREAEQAFKSPAGLNMLANNMLYDRAREHLLSIAKGEIEAVEESLDEAEATSEASAEPEAAEKPIVDQEVTEPEAAAADDTITEVATVAVEENLEEE